MAGLKPGKRQGAYALSNSKFLNPSEYDQLTMVLQRNLKNPAHFRDALILSVAVHTGARAKEVLNIKKSDFDELHGSLYVTGIKGSRDRDIPLPKWLSLELRQFIRPLAPQDRLFPITYNRFRQIWLVYRPAQKKLHCLRHTFALRVYMRTNDVRLLQIALGHKSILNTMIYVDFMYSRNELRRLVEKDEKSDEKP